jgi:hypothetical protein
MRKNDVLILLYYISLLYYIFSIGPCTCEFFFTLLLWQSCLNSAAIAAKLIKIPEASRYVHLQQFS